MCPTERMANFDPILRNGKFLSAVVILIFVFALFNHQFRSPLDLSLLILYGYFLLIQFSTAVTLLLSRVHDISNLHVHVIYFALILSTIIGLLLLILFSAPLVRIVHCCIYTLSGFEGITSELPFDCSSLKCDENIIPIALPTLIFALCALWSHQQIFNVHQFLIQRNREIDDYNRIIEASVVSVAPHAFSDPYDESSIRSS